MTNKGKCRSCDAEVYWLRNAKTTNLSPIDALPDPTGNCEIDTESGTYRTLNKITAAAARELGAELHLNHFATCPNRATHHKRAPGA